MANWRQRGYDDCMNKIIDSLSNIEISQANIRMLDDMRSDSGDTNYVEGWFEAIHNVRTYWDQYTEDYCDQGDE